MKIILDDLSHSTHKQSINTTTPELITAAINVMVSSTPVCVSDDDSTIKTSTPKKEGGDHQTSPIILKPAKSTPSLNKKHLNNLISIKTSATLCAIPDILMNKNKKTGSIRNCYSYSSNMPYLHKSSRAFSGSLDIHNCNDEIAAVQDLIENKFSRNSSGGDFFEKFNLPVLRLANDNIEIENYIENNMITSNLKFNKKFRDHFYK